MSYLHVARSIAMNKQHGEKKGTESQLYLKNITERYNATFFRLYSKPSPGTLKHFNNVYMQHIENIFFFSVGDISTSQRCTNCKSQKQDKKGKYIFTIIKTYVT